MRTRDRWITAVSAGIATPALLAALALADTPTTPAHGAMLRNLSEMKFAKVPGMPSCAEASVQDGDPSKGPSVLIARMTAGCVVPWHFHSPNEHVMMVSGTATMEMKDAKAKTLRAGAYARMPSKHVHQFRCIKNCAFFVSSDAAFDIHYIDAEGNEIPPEQALKARHKPVTASR